MNTNILKLLLYIPIIGCYFYHDTNYDTMSNVSNGTNNSIKVSVGICGIIVYLSYTYLYKLSFTNVYFAMSITPKHFSDSLHGSHKIIAYGFSTIHAVFISLSATLYLLKIIDNYDIKQVFYISMSYYLADIVYVIDSTKKLTKLDYFTICHHNIMIIMYNLIFIQIYNDLNLENNLLYYMNRGLLAEYSVLPLNYSWYLVNTKQDTTNKMFISSLLTLILYFITRVINFTRLIFNFWYDDLIPAIVLMMPLFLVNYYWFYKLFCKANRIYKENRNKN